MPGDVKLDVVDPDRAATPERRPKQPLAQLRDALQPLDDGDSMTSNDAWPASITIQSYVKIASCVASVADCEEWEGLKALEAHRWRSG